MAVQPWPVVIFDGVMQKCLVIDLYTDPVVLDGLEIDWGRSEYMSHSGVGTLNVEWIDRTTQGEVTFTTEPGSGAVKRGWINFLEILPIEWLL